VKRVIFHPEADAEMVAAAEFYDAKNAGLGRDFIAEVERATRALLVHSRIGHRFSRRLRRVLVQRFPYGLLYRSKASESSWLPSRISGGDQGTGVTANLPNLRFQRPALRAAAEPPTR
jgi:hypothetical protein